MIYTFHYMRHGTKCTEQDDNLQWLTQWASGGAESDQHSPINIVDENGNEVVSVNEIWDAWKVKNKEPKTIKELSQIAWDEWNIGNLSESLTKQAWRSGWEYCRRKI